MKALLTSLLVCAAACLTGLPTASAQNTLRAAAVVNDEVISVLDLSMRIRIAIVSSGLDDTPETRRRLASPVLRQLIDEQLQLQEAERLDIVIEDQQVAQAFAEIAKRNGLEAAQFRQVLQREGILPDALETQLRAQLIWNTVISRRIVPNVRITDEEVEETLARQRENEGQPEVHVSEIFLAYDTPAEEQQVETTARRLVQQLREGASFAAVARQFSQSGTASVGGDLGWVLEDALPPELVQSIQTMEPGQMAGPIRTLGGFYLVLLRERRRVQTTGEATLRLTQVLFPAPAGQEAAVIAQAARETAEVQSCAQADALAQRIGTEGSGNLGDVSLSDLPPSVRQAVADLPIGQPSEPILVPNAVSVLVVCLRRNEGGGLDRDTIARNLERDRVDMLSRRYMRDLRRAANVDIRV